MKFHRNTASEIAVALFLAACSAGGEVKEPMKGDNQALVEIGTAQELEQFRDRVNEGEAALDALLTADIDLSSVCGSDAGNWVPFEEYNGVFDGKGHENSGLYTEAEEGDRALFQTIGYAGIVKELESAGARIQVPGTAAALAIRNEGIVENCCSRDGQIKGHEAMGLLREPAEESSVSGCYATGSVEGKDRAAGIAGSVQNTRVENCSNSGTVDGAWDSGGVLGGAGLSDRGGIMRGDEVETFLYNSYFACTLSEKAGGLSYSDAMTEMDSVFYQSDTAVGYILPGGTEFRIPFALFQRSSLPAGKY